MEFIRLTTQHPDYDFALSLWHEAFPPEERRLDEKQRVETDSNPRFYNCLIRHEGQNIGLFNYWEFDDFRYGEHFAISPTVRNGGYGGKVLEALYALSPKPFVLEVEMPTTTDAARRINFYQRHQFELWPNLYHQPPYAPGFPEIPMHLMVRGDLTPALHYETIVETLRREVYRCL